MSERNYHYVIDHYTDNGPEIWVVWQQWSDGRVRSFGIHATAADAEAERRELMNADRGV